MIKFNSEGRFTDTEIPAKVPAPVILAVKVHNGHGYTRGKANNYPYFVAQVFEASQRKSGKVSYQATGIIAGPFRSEAKARREGMDLALSRGAEFIPGYGSLHNQDVIEK